MSNLTTPPQGKEKLLEDLSDLVKATNNLVSTDEDVAELQRVKNLAAQGRVLKKIKEIQVNLDNFYDKIKTLYINQP